MAVRPPSNDGDDGPDTVEFGIVALDARIEERNISFPATVDDLGKYDDLQIAVDPAGHTMSLGEALSRCETQEFSSKTALLDALHPIFEAERQSVSGGIFGRLRALVPF